MLYCSTVDWKQYKLPGAAPLPLPESTISENQEEKTCLIPL